MINMLKKVSIASALALTFAVSAHAKVVSGGLVEDTTIVPVYVANGSFSDLINFTVSPNAGAGLLTSALSYSTKGATLTSISLYEGTFSSLSALTGATKVWSSSSVSSFADGSSVSTKISGDVGVLDYTKSYTLLVNGTGMVKGGYTAQITLDSLPAVPEPETYAMLLAGLGLMGAIARRKSKRTVSADAVAA